MRIERLAHVDLDGIFCDLSRNLRLNFFHSKKDCSSPSMWQPGIGLANFVSGWCNVVQAL